MTLQHETSVLEQTSAFLIRKSTASHQIKGPKGATPPKVLLFGYPHNMSGPSQTVRLKTLLKSYGADTLFAPIPSKSNAKIAEHSEFTPHATAPFLFLNGVLADGVILDKPGQACLIKSADCPTVIIYNPLLDPKKRKVAVAHCGRDSLLDGSVFKGFSKSRNHFSVIDAILMTFDRSELPVLVVHTALGIAPKHFGHSFSHPEFGKQNRAMVEYISDHFGRHCVGTDLRCGQLDLHEIIKSQCVKFGILPKNITRDKFDTFSSKRLFGNDTYQWHSHRRDGKKDIKGSNGVLVLHTARQS